MMVYTFFAFAAFLPNFTRLLQSHFSTHMLYDSWNSGIVSDILSALSKKAVRNKKKPIFPVCCRFSYFWQVAAEP